jgi:hypothetical protein
MWRNNAVDTLARASKSGSNFNSIIRRFADIMLTPFDVLSTEHALNASPNLALLVVRVLLYFR